jgi:hypothetical protein
MLAGAVLACYVVIAKVIDQTKNIHTYHWQMWQASTPQEYRDAARDLNQALIDAGMVSGNTFWRDAPHEEMEYIRGRILSLADRADHLDGHDLTSTEVSTGLADIKDTGGRLMISPYTYWLFRQGGIWPAAYWPSIMVVLGLVATISGMMLPGVVRRRIPTQAAPA